MPLLQRVRRHARRHGLWGRDTRIVAAVSGGSDSVAMLRLLHDLHCRGELQLDVVAHLNHLIRPDADADEAFCGALAAELGLPFISSRVDVPAIARASRRSLELSGRIARRRFLDDVRRTRGAERIAIAHTEDDQAETVLLRLVRGAAQRGLAAIAPIDQNRIRPVLCATRAELRAELASRGQGWRDDPTNADLSHPRNRVRHELLPYLERHFNPSTRRALVRLADSARADEALLSRAAAAAAVAVVVRDGDHVRLDARSLAALPDAVARRVALYALAASARQAGADAVAAILEVARGERARVDVPGLRVEHFAGFVVLVPSSVPRGLKPFEASLSVPGVAEDEGAGWRIEAEGPLDRPIPPSVSANLAQIDAEAVDGRLVVRSRRRGDRMRPAGLGGSKKLQDIFTDRKVSRLERDRIPVVTDGAGRIVWVAGHVLGEEFRVTDRTKAVIILKLRRI